MGIPSSDTLAKLAQILQANPYAAVLAYLPEPIDELALIFGTNVNTINLPTNLGNYTVGSDGNLPYAEELDGGVKKLVINGTRICYVLSKHSMQQNGH